MLILRLRFKWFLFYILNGLFLKIFRLSIDVFCWILAKFFYCSYMFFNIFFSFFISDRFWLLNLFWWLCHISFYFCYWMKKLKSLMISSGFQQSLKSNIDIIFYIKFLLWANFEVATKTSIHKDNLLQYYNRK